MLEQSVSHCEQRGEQQLFDKRQGNFTLLFNLHSGLCQLRALHKSPLGVPAFRPHPWPLGQCLQQSWGRGRGLWCPQASQSVGQGGRQWSQSLQVLFYVGPISPRVTRSRR